ncbi:MAG: hypothetical protein NTY94_03655 [Alphaproteobacteria bacterium]|nr:hypothetical protein [Alphaproteobacteria bacterium]
MSRATTRAATLAALAWLAACAAPPQGGTTAGTTVGTAPQPAATPETPPAEATLPVDSLLHVRTGELRARFGDPHGQRRDGGAIVWNYEADGVCRLNLVLQGVRGAAAEVVHAQARMAPGGTEEACFDRLRQEARISPPPPPARASTRPAARPAAQQARPAAASRAAQRPAASRPGT